MQRLILSYSDLSQYHKAIHLYKRMLELYKFILVNKYPNIFRFMNSIATSYSNISQSKKSISLQKQIVGLRKYILGNKHPNTI